MKNTLHFFQVFALAFFLVFSLSSAAPIDSNNDHNHNDKEHRKEQRKAKRQKKLKKLLSSKAVKFVLRQIQKRKERLQRKLQKAEKAGKVKKAKRIKYRLQLGINSTLAFWLIRAGLIVLIIGLLLVAANAGSGGETNTGFAFTLLILGGLVFLVGFVLWIIELVEGF